MREVTVYRVDYGRKTKDPIGTVLEKRKTERAHNYHALALAFAVMVRGAGPVSFDRVLSGKR